MGGLHPNENLGPHYIKLAFDLHQALDLPAMAIDLIESPSGEIYVVEMSYGFPSKNFLDGASGYWTSELRFVRNRIKLQEWMVERVVKQTAKRENRRENH